MAPLWIKITHWTPDKPEVFCVAELLKIDPDAVVGKLVRVWIWADQQLESCNALSVTKTLLDRIASVTGFADALQKVGWLDETDDGLVFTNFERHNGKTAKNRANTAIRVESHRTRNADSVTKTLQVKRKCNARNVTTALPDREEDREEEIKEPPIPPEGGAADAANVDDQDGTDIDDPEFSTSSMAFVVGEWNLVGATKSRKISKKVAGFLRARMKDPWWMTHWQEALEQLPKCKGIWGDNDRGWKCNFEWFVRPDTVQNIIEGGKYGNSPPNATECPVPATGGRRTATASSLDAIGRFAARHAAGGSQGIGEPLCLEANG
jgi:hypothetical protein